MDNPATPREIYNATIDCRHSLQECLTIDALARGGWAENRLADFNLWAAGVGAAVTHTASLDHRLQFHPKVSLVLTGILNTLKAVIDECKDLALNAQDVVQIQEDEATPVSDHDNHSATQGDSSRESASDWFNSLQADSGAEYASESESDTDDEEESSLHAAMADAEVALDQLLRLGHAIRKSGTTARLQKADRSFNAGDYQDFQRYLVIALKHGSPSLKPADPTATTDSRIREYEQSLETLTPAQEHLILANLRRRHRFTYARRHQIKLEAHQHLTLRPQTLPVGKPTEPIDARTVDQKNRNHGTETQSQVSKEKQPEDANAKTRPHDSGMTVTTASVAEGDILKTPTPSQAASRVSVTAQKLDYPLPPPVTEGTRSFKCPCCYQTLPAMFLERSRWRKHLAEDLRPYTCPFNDCPSGLVLYTSRSMWKDHINKQHGSSQSWDCLACSGHETPPMFLTLDIFTIHIQTEHKDTITEDQIPNLQEVCCRLIPSIFELCPLCSRGPEKFGSDGLSLDAEAFVDHIGDCIHDFSLKALPWADSKEEKHGLSTTQARSIELSNKISTWCDGIEKPEAIKDDDFNHTLKFTDNAAELESGMEFIASEYFAEGQDNTTQIGRDSSRDDLSSESAMNSDVSEEDNTVSSQISDDARRKGMTAKEILDELQRERGLAWDLFKLEDIYGHIKEFSLVPAGSRFLRHEMRKATDSEKDWVLTEIEPDAVELITSDFGSNVMWSLFGFTNETQKDRLVGMIRGQIAELSKEANGSWFLRGVFHHIPADQVAQLAQELQPEIAVLMTNANASLLITEIIELHLCPHFILDYAYKNAEDLACDTFGEDVIGSLLRNGPAEYVASLKERLLNNFEALMTDLRGSHVLEALGESLPVENWVQLRNYILDNFRSFSTDKNTRYRLDILINIWPPDEWNLLVDHLQEQGGLLPHLIQNENGNRVIRDILNTLEGDERARLVDSIRPHLSALKNSAASPEVERLGQTIRNLIGRPVSEEDDAFTNSNDHSVPNPLTSHQSPPSQPDPVNVSDQEDAESMPGSTSPAIEPNQSINDQPDGAGLASDTEGQDERL